MIKNCVYISIFNPLTVSMVFVKLFSTQVVLDISQGQVSRNEVQNSNKLTCGLRISDFAVGSKVEEAGIVKGENIFRLNGVQIGSIQDIFDQLNNKKIGDNVSLETDQGLKIVELVPNANDPSRPALGVKLIYNQCK